MIVLVDCEDPAVALVLSAAPNVLVHWLIGDIAELADARSCIRDAEVDGRISASVFQDSRFPYADNMVNLLVLGKDSALGTNEIDRVLVPGGAVVRLGGGKIVSCRRKPRSADVDEWTHSRHDSTGNAVSADKRAGPPHSLQWEALPRWNRGTKTSAVVSSGGRIFYILDDSHFHSNKRTWSLIARDAYNGVRLWRRELSQWEGAGYGKKVGPAQVNRRLAAVGGYVYAQLADAAAVSVLDAATGKTIRMLEGTENAEEFLVSEGVLAALVNDSNTPEFWHSLERRMRIIAVRPETGEVLWTRGGCNILPMTMTADGRQVVYHNGKSVCSVDLFDGKPRWTSPATDQEIVTQNSWNPDRPGADNSKIILAPQFAPTVLIYKDVVAFAGGKQLNVVSAEDGRELWRAPYAATNYSVPVDLFGFDGMIWGPDRDMNLWRPLDDDISYKAYDPLTGEVKKSVKGHYDFKFQHHRCHQMKVLGNTVVAGRAGIEFVDTDSGRVAAHHWIRGSCYFGVLPANGLLYVPPHNCACYIRAKLSGFMAFRSEASLTAENLIKDEQRLERGKAYGQTSARTVKNDPRDWPTYRHDGGRSGSTAAEVGPELGVGWRTDLGGNLTSPVAAGGRVYLASRDEHLLYALDADTGKIIWRYSFDARVDSPPTVCNGLVIAGCRDGSVVALRAADGSLIWRFIAAPAQRMIVSRGQLESVWPVHGSVLVLDDTVYFAAGKSSYIDGGLRLYGLEPHTGRKVVETVLHTRGKDGSQILDDQAVDGFLNDILSSDGRRLFLRHHILGKSGRPQPGRITHLHGPDGYLSADTTNRLIWTYAPLYTSPHQGAFYDLRLVRTLFPSGRLLVEDGDTIYGFGQNHYEKLTTDPGGSFELFASPKESDVPLDITAREYRKLALAGKHQVRFHWHRRMPVHVWAIVKTKNKLFVAGAGAGASVPQAALDGHGPGKLLAVSPTDGSSLSAAELPAMPVWDGIAAVENRLYIALADGSIVCMKE